MITNPSLSKGETSVDVNFETDDTINDFDVRIYSEDQLTTPVGGGPGGSPKAGILEFLNVPKPDVPGLTGLAFGQEQYAWVPGVQYAAYIYQGAEIAATNLLTW